MKKGELKLIREITAEAWGKFGKKLFVEKPVAPTIKKIADLALNEEADKFTDAQRGEIRAALATGEFDKTALVEDEKVAKEYEEYVQKRIEEEIKKGNLSKPEKKKVKQYTNRSKKK